MVLFSNGYLAALCFDRGAAAMNANDFVGAIAAFEQCIEHRPTDLLGHWHLALCLLALGDYERAWPEFEYRWQLCDWTWGLLGEDIYRVADLPLWSGEALEGKNLLVHHEMGYGDSIQMLRYLPELKARGARLTLVVPHALHSLIATQFNIETTTSVPENLSGFAYRVPLFSLPRILGQTRDTIPGAPYIAPPLCCGADRRIGIAWTGRSRRELTREQFVGLLGAGRHYVDLIPPMFAGDFADLVGVMAQMEHIVTVDTAAAHLAAAMGHPSVHVVLPWNRDWRWYNARAWYPTINIYPQTRSDDWSEPFARINDHIN